MLGSAARDSNIAVCMLSHSQLASLSNHSLFFKKSLNWRRGWWDDSVDKNAHEDLSSDLTTHLNLGLTVCICNLGAGGGKGQVAGSQAYWPVSPVEPLGAKVSGSPSQKGRWKVTEKDIWP